MAHFDNARVHFLVCALVGRRVVVVSAHESREDAERALKEGEFIRHGAQDTAGRWQPM